VKSPAARVALGIFLVAAAGPAGFLMYRLIFAGRLPAHPVVTSAAPLASAPSQATPPSGLSPEQARPVPTELPDLALPDLEGKTRNLRDFRGKAVLVNFWATWCEPCRREIPLLKSLRQHEPAPGLEVVGIAVDMRAPVLQYARDMGIDYPLLMGEQDGLKAVDAFGMQAVFPFSVFADREGHIVALKVGELHPEEAELILGRVRLVDAGGLPLAAAREQISAGLRRLSVERAQGAQPAAGVAPGKS